MLILGIGSNIDNRLRYIQKAVDALKNLPALNIQTISSVYESDALLPDDAPTHWDMPYLNIALSCQTHLAPHDLLSQLKNIEADIGREANGRWGPRVIDIDVLAWGDRVLQDEHLHIPHVDLIERPFALWPLADVAPNWQYPLPGIYEGKTAHELTQTWGSRFSGKAPLKTRQINASIESTQLMGILNATPDSFSGDGQVGRPEALLQQAKHFIASGASVIDLGAESTRPGAPVVSPEEEWQRLEPILKALQPIIKNTILSVDTRHLATAEKALQYGMNWLNDQSGLEDPRMQAFAAQHDFDVVVMHNLGLPANRDVVIALEESPVSVVYQWAEKRLAELEKVGIKRQRIIFDVGIGFGKTAEQSWELINNIHVFHDLGVRLLVGHSRKSFFNLVTELPFSERDIETVVISTHLAKQHVHYLRVHDVAGNARGLKVSSRA